MGPPQTRVAVRAAMPGERWGREPQCGVCVTAALIRTAVSGSPGCQALRGRVLPAEERGVHEERKELVPGSKELFLVQRRYGESA